MTVTPDSRQVNGTSVEVTITWSAPGGLANATRTTYVDGSPVNFTSWTYTPNGTNTIATQRGVLQLGQPGTSKTFRARIVDQAGQESEATVVYSAPDTRRAPNVTVDSAHHEGFRNIATEGGNALGFSTPAYVSLDQPRSASLMYHTRQAAPTGFVQVNVSDPSYEKAYRMSLQVVDTRTNAAVTLQNGQTEIFFRGGYGATYRMAAEWPMTNEPTGDYKFRVVVRSYWESGPPTETVRTVRVLVVNERQSAFGVGWSMPGAKRLHFSNFRHPTIAGQAEGVMLASGDGIALFYTLASCAPTHCTYTSPAGDPWVLRHHVSLGAERWDRISPDGTEEIYHHDNGLLHTVTDRFGNRSTVHWRGSPFVAPVAWDDPAGLRTSLIYNTAGRVERIVDPGNRATVLEYYGAHLARGRLPDNSLALEATYDTQSIAVTSKDSRGTTWHYAYTTVGADTVLATAVHAPIVTRKVQQVIVPQRKNAMRFQATSLASPASLVPLDSVLTRAADANGHTALVQQDRFGNVVFAQNHFGDQVRTTYNERGLPLTSVDKNDGTKYEYNTRGELISQSVGDPERGYQEVFRAWYSRPLYPDSTKSMGQTTHLRYGSRNELVRVWTGPSADSLKAMTSFSVDSRGRVGSTISVPSNTSSTRTFATSGWQNTAASCERRQVRMGVKDVCSTFAWDAYGRTTQVSLPDGGAVATVYDAVGRVESTTENGRRSSWTYRGPDVLAFTDPGAKKYQWQYDGFGRLTVETDPEGRTRSFGYNADGLLETRTDRLGSTVTVAYDDRHRIRTRAASATRSGVAGDTTTFTYLEYPDRVVVHNRMSTDTLESDAMFGNLKRQVTVRGGRRYVFEQQIDAATGRPTKVSVSALSGGVTAWGGDMRYSYDDQPVETGLPGLDLKYGITSMSGKTTSFSFGYGGLLRGIGYPTGQQQRFVYDASRRPNIAPFYRAGTGEPDDALTNALAGTYYYDEMGRLSSRNSHVDDVVKNYGYDLGGRLTSVTTNTRSTGGVLASEAFAYDAVGNRTDSGAAVDAGSNRYTDFGSWDLSYDAEGNLIRKVNSSAQWTYAWDALGRMASATVYLPASQMSRETSYGYDGLGQRVKRVDHKAGTTHYLYYQGNLFAELNGSQNVIRSYTYSGTDRPATVTVGNPTTGTTFSYVSEQPGHVVGLLDGSGQLVSRYRYGAFGARESSTVEQVTQPLQYMARELDSSTGLYYVRARWYDRDLGRFVSEDPIGLAGGINTYAYVDNDPINARDPSGLAPCPDEPGHQNAACSSHLLDMFFITFRVRWWEDGIHDVWAGTRAHDFDRIDPRDMLTRYGPARSHNVRPDQSTHTECSRTGSCPTYDSWAVCSVDVLATVSGVRAIAGLYKTGRAVNAFHAASRANQRSVRYHIARRAVEGPHNAGVRDMYLPSVGASVDEAIQQAAHGEFDATAHAYPWLDTALDIFTPINSCNNLPGG